MQAFVVKSIKGPQGGYLLNRDPKDIAVAEILEALDGTYRLEDQEMQEKSSCPEITDTIQNLLINRVNAQLDQVLQNLTLEDLVKDYLERRDYGQNMYYI